VTNHNKAIFIQKNTISEVYKEKSSFPNNAATATDFKNELLEAIWSERFMVDCLKLLGPFLKRKKSYEVVML